MLLTEAALAAGLPVDEATKKASVDLLIGCVINRRMMIAHRDLPLYDAARIDAIHEQVRPGKASTWSFDLTVLSTDDKEEAIDLRFLSNLAVIADASEAKGSAKLLLSALREEACALRLKEAIQTTRAAQGVAVRKWYELLGREKLEEDEPIAGQNMWVIVGFYSSHERLFSLLVGARDALLDCLNRIPLAQYNAVVEECAVPTFDEWPAERRQVASDWVRWLLSLEERAQGYPALFEYLHLESQLGHHEHLARDDAGRFSLPKTAAEIFMMFAVRLEQLGMMPPIHPPNDTACARLYAHVLHVFVLADPLCPPLLLQVQYAPIPLPTAWVVAPHGRSLSRVAIGCAWRAI